MSRTPANIISLAPPSFGALHPDDPVRDLIFPEPPKMSAHARAELDEALAQIAQNEGRRGMSGPATIDDDPTIAALESLLEAQSRPTRTARPASRNEGMSPRTSRVIRGGRG